MTILKSLIRRRSAKAPRSFWTDREGAVLVYVSITAVALFAMVALVIDFSRLQITHTAARAAAEGAALAGASQLNGTTDAITRATQAAQSFDLVENDQKLAQGATKVSIVSIRFLDGLPAGDPNLPEDTSVLDPFVLDPTDPDSALEARFIEVTTEQLTVNNSFIVAVGGNATSATRATAVAGFTQTICRRAPLAICNPMENPTAAFGTKAPPMNVEAWKGRMVLVKASGPSSAWTPGDFSLVDIDGLQSAKEIWGALAESEPDVCINAIINLKPGQTQSVRTALNTRFDMYDNPVPGGLDPKNHPKMHPAQNVVKGKVLSDPTDTCSFDDPTGGGSMALPRDKNSRAHEGTSFSPGAPSNTARFGDGTWDCLLYWTTMHGAAPVPSGCGANSSPTHATDNMTRQELYKYEIANTVPNNAPIGENGDPAQGMCYSGPTAPNATTDRREVFFAVVNCRELGPLNGNSAGNLSVAAFVKAFLTEPVAAASDGPEIILEIVDIAQPGADDGVLHDIVQLYR